MKLLFVLPLLFSLIHVTEEFIFPGGFKKWYIEYRPEVKKGLTDRFLVTINTFVEAIGVLVIFQGPRNGIGTWLILMSALFWNGIFHITGAIKTKKYSPGMISGTLLYIPLFIIGTYEIFQAMDVPVLEAVVCIGIGSLYHILSLTRHRIIAKRVSSR